MRKLMMAAAFAATACGGTDQVEHQQTGEAACPPGISIVDAWTKPARAGQPVSAAYVTICNGGPADDALLSIASGPEEVASSIEVHNSTMTDGVMSMTQTDRIALPAGARVTLEQGGAHIMLIGVVRDITGGAEPTFRLDFENAEDIFWSFEVRDESGAHDGHH